MKSKKTLGDILAGKNKEAIPNIAFHVMTLEKRWTDGGNQCYFPDTPKKYSGPNAIPASNPFIALRG
jgi:hypothetical protein